MSYSVLVVPEDPTHNGDILEPLVSRMLTELPDIVERYRDFDLILFLVDADGKDKAAAFQALESNAASNGLALFWLPLSRRWRSGYWQVTRMFSNRFSRNMEISGDMAAVGTC